MAKIRNVQGRAEKEKKSNKSTSAITPQLAPDFYSERAVAEQFANIPTIPRTVTAHGDVFVKDGYKDYSQAPSLPNYANAKMNLNPTADINGNPQMVEPTLPDWANKELSPEFNKDVLDGIINNGVYGVDWSQPANEPAEEQPNDLDLWKSRMDALYNDIQNKTFNFDLNGEELYHQYRDQYMRNGSLASKDAMGQAAGLTGGYGSSYSQAVGNQAYGAYQSQLNNVVPEIYQQSYNRFADERNALIDQYELAYRNYGNELDNQYNQQKLLLDAAELDMKQRQQDFDNSIAQKKADTDYYNAQTNRWKTVNDPTYAGATIDNSMFETPESPTGKLDANVSVANLGADEFESRVYDQLLDIIDSFDFSAGASLGGLEPKYRKAYIIARIQNAYNFTSEQREAMYALLDEMEKQNKL